MDEEKGNYDFLFKLVLLGDSAVGKSSILVRFSDDEFVESHINTIGVDFRYRTVTIDNHVVKLQIWDTAGQEKYRTIVRAYYRGADGVVLVYDVTNQDSFDHVDEWLADVDKFAERNPVRLLVGNKADLMDQRQVSEELASKYAEENHISWLETSAKTNTNIHAIFLTLAKELIKRKMEETAAEAAQDPGKLKLGPSSEEHDKCSKC